VAKFTAPVRLNIRWNGLDISGAAGATHRIPDALYEEFNSEVAPGIPGGVTWIDADEVSTLSGSLSSPFHSALQGVTANQHHAQAHAIGGADHTGTLAHSALGSVGANDHHAQAHSISGADHTGTLAHSALGSVTADQHHAQSHDHSAAADGSTLSPGTFNIPGGIKISAATVFPGSPATGQLCYRTDLHAEFYYDGTRWLSKNVHWTSLGNSGVTSLSATTNNVGWAGIGDLLGGSDIYLLDCEWYIFVNTGGTALGASHKWTLTLDKGADGTATLTNVVTADLASGNNGNRLVTTAINALLNNGTTHDGFRFSVAKTGTPGAIFTTVRVAYRIVAT
jgi:hypothetical protein